MTTSEHARYAAALTRTVDLLRRSNEAGEPQKAALRALVIACAERSGTLRFYDSVLTVDGIAVPMPHFGAILDWEEFHAVAARIRTAGLAFVIEPRGRFEGQLGEQMTMFFLDPSGNALEFKAFRLPQHMFTA